MKPIAFILALTSAAVFVQGAPQVTSAAKVKPSAKWEDYPTRLVSSLPGYKPTTDGELSTCGGLKREQHKATGFFHAEISGKRWWLVDPEGRPFIHVGVVAVSPPGGNKTAPDWAEATSNLLHDHGFNGTGAWSENERIRAGKRPVVYTKIWNFMTSWNGQHHGCRLRGEDTGGPRPFLSEFHPRTA